MTLEPNDRRPKHRQLADWVIERILDETLSPGDRLPSARELMSQFDVSSQTVQTALKLLQAEQLAVGVPGRGTFLVDDIDLEALRHGSNPSNLYAALTERLDELADEMKRVHKRLDEVEAAQRQKRPAKRS